MDALRRIIENSTNPLTIDLPEGYENQKLEVIVLPLEEVTGQEQKKNYDFSELAGKLKWQGDAVAEQRKLRAERE